MPYEKAPSSGAFLPLSLMHILSGEPMHDLSGVDTTSHADATAISPILSSHRECGLSSPANVGMRPLKI
jgi:hypothetical protein